MADYYPLLARALDALPDRSPPLRRAVYDRARSALIGQLKSLEPPLPEADIDLERQALDAAIAKLEAAYGASPPAHASATGMPAPSPGDAPPRQPPEEAKPPPPVEPVRKPAPPEPPPVPSPDSREALPEPGPPAEFVPFVPPPRKPKSDEAPAVPELETAADPAAEAPAGQAEASNGRQRPHIDVKAPRAERSRLLRNLFVAGILAVVIGLIAVAAYFLRDKPSDLPPPGSEAGGSSGPVPESKLSDRVGGERPPEPPRSTAPEPGAQPDVAVAQRALLFEENPDDPKAMPPAKTGRVIWRLETVSGEQGQPLQTAIRADIDYPEVGLSLAMTIKKNLDTALPASHTIELAFSSKEGDSKRVVQDIGLLQLKDDESGRGAPVSGLPVRVRENLFLIGLSNLPNDIERNTEMLRNREWFDLAIRYKPGPRAILGFEKGSAGRQVFQSAFDQWRE